MEPIIDGEEVSMRRKTWCTQSLPLGTINVERRPFIIADNFRGRRGRRGEKQSNTEETNETERKY